jgi:hypothetical protein
LASGATIRESRSEPDKAHRDKPSLGRLSSAFRSCNEPTTWRFVNPR